MLTRSSEDDDLGLTLAMTYDAGSKFFYRGSHQEWGTPIIVCWVFIMNGCWILSHAFSRSTDTIIWPSCLTCWCDGSWFVMLSDSQTWLAYLPKKSIWFFLYIVSIYFIQIRQTEIVFKHLFIHCWIWSANILPRTFTSRSDQWPVVFLSYNVGFWYQDNTDPEWVRKGSFCFYFLENSLKIYMTSSLNVW